MGLRSKIGEYFEGFCRRIEVCMAYREIRRFSEIDGSKITNYDILNYNGARACIKEHYLSIERNPKKLARLGKQWDNAINHVDDLIGKLNFARPILSD